MLNILPGPDSFYILGRSIAQGKAVGIASSLGISAGAFIHTILAMVGLSAVLTASTTIFLIVKLLGASYLICLGVKMLMQKDITQLTNKLNNNPSHLTYINQLTGGLLVCLGLKILSKET